MPLEERFPTMSHSPTADFCRWTKLGLNYHTQFMRRSILLDVRIMTVYKHQQKWSLIQSWQNKVSANNWAKMRSSVQFRWIVVCVYLELTSIHTIQLSMPKSAVFTHLSYNRSKAYRDLQIPFWPDEYVYW